MNHLINGEIKSFGGNYRCLIVGDKKIAVNPNHLKNFFKSIHINIINGKKELQKVNVNIKSLSREFKVSKSSIIYHTLIGKIDPYLLKIHKRTSPSIPIKPVAPPIDPIPVKPAPLPIPSIKPIPKINPTPPPLTFKDKLRLQNSLYNSGKSKISGDVVQRICEVYRTTATQSNCKKFLHLTPDNMAVVFLKLKDLNNPEILIGEHKGDAFISQGAYGKILKVSALGSETFSDKYVLKISKTQNSSVTNESKILQNIKNRVGNNRKFGIQKPPSAKNSHIYVTKRALGNLYHVNFAKVKEEQFLTKSCLPLLLGLKTLAESKITHGDIKPDNCLYDKDGAYIADFGSAAIIDENNVFNTPIGPATVGFYNQPAPAPNDFMNFFDSYFDPGKVEAQKQSHLHFLQKRDVFAMGKTLKFLLDRYYGNKIPEPLSRCIAVMTARRSERCFPEQAWEMWQKAVQVVLSNQQA